ncbi:hypothetical protein [Fodinicola feengrottensis]|uniref:hypothetical protein n=1 Tax=Fodinicola feengrottensis TaxID=435914 RepID=UPI002442E5F4|nr:hypothetical protein [Fodinicola feengrottensis]
MSTDSDAGGRTDVLGPFRLPICFALLLGLNAVVLLIAIEQLIIPAGGASFTYRAALTFEQFVGLVVVTLPLIAAAVATYVGPKLRLAQVVGYVALGEYALAALFGLISFVAGFFNGGGGESGPATADLRATVEGALLHLTELALLAVAILAVVKISGLLDTQKRVPSTAFAPPGYGQPGPLGQQLGQQPVQIGDQGGQPQQYDQFGLPVGEPTPGAGFPPVAVSGSPAAPPFAEPASGVPAPVSGASVSGPGGGEPGLFGGGPVPSGGPGEGAGSPWPSSAPPANAPLTAPPPGSVPLLRTDLGLRLTARSGVGRTVPAPSGRRRRL